MGAGGVAGRPRRLQPHLMAADRALIRFAFRRAGCRDHWIKRISRHRKTASATSVLYTPYGRSCNCFLTQARYSFDGRP